jgi:hypothetical protein
VYFQKNVVLIMITIIFGGIVTGKTSLMTYFALRHILFFSREDVGNCRNLLRDLNKGGFNYSCDEKHLVFSDYYIKSRIRGFPLRFSHDIDGFSLGLPNSVHHTSFLPPFSQIYLDEAQRYYNSRVNASLFPDFVSYFYEVHRHYDLNITMACQRSDLIDKNIREIGERFIETIKFDVYYDKDGNIKRCVWRCHEFGNLFELNSYLSSNKRHFKGEKIKYKFDGDIFQCYESKGRFPLFLNGRYNSKFDIVPGKLILNTVDDIKLYNERHSVGVPETFYGKKSRG